jgi:hypothetical protein
MPGEIERYQDEVSIKNFGKGILIITNVRILWQPIGDASYLIN